VATALGLRDAYGGGRVGVLAALDDGTEARLRSWIAVGVDAVAMMELPDGTDDVAVSGFLAGFAEQVGADVVLVRHRTSGFESCLIGPATAELLGWIGITSVIGADASASGGLRVRRLVDGEIEHLDSATPAVLAVARGNGLPYPTLSQRNRARTAVIRKLDAETVIGGVPEAAVASAKTLRHVPVDPSPGSERALDRGVGAASGSSSDVIEGSPDEMAARLAEVCRRVLVR
jgi:electron transfer flavoprotein alpha/beta subunit